MAWCYGSDFLWSLAKGGTWKGGGGESLDEVKREKERFRGLN